MIWFPRNIPIRRKLTLVVLVSSTAALLVASAVWYPFRQNFTHTGPNEGEYGTKAEYLLGFARFVGWPARKFSQPDAPLVIGIVGSDPFGDLLSKVVQNAQVIGRPVMVRHVDQVEEWRKCHILFVCRSEAERMENILSGVRGHNVLTVGESDKFIPAGGMINFVMAGNTVRFQIDDAEARHAGLAINSRLLTLAVPREPVTAL